METIRAAVVNDDNNYFIEISDQNLIRIPISNDDPKEVKKAFNKLLLRLKKGAFEIELEEETEDLFCQVAKEYIKQLNSELQEVYEEMDEHGLTI